jgi:hypothetical protein
VRGHRVSNCQHSDRRLQHINRKGRPVSQCQHCRSMRKSRSAHVKCDCGNKNKCVHLQPTMDGHKETCCCNHGGKCTCVTETLALESVPESEKETAPGVSRATSIRRRRANTTSSEGAAPQTSRHKTTTQKKRLSQKGGISRVNSASEVMSSMSSTPSRDVTSRPRSSNSHHYESELSSPNVGASPTFPNGLAPLDLSRISYPSYPSGGFDVFGGPGFSADDDAPLSSAGLAPPSDTWSTSDFSASSYRMAHSFGSLVDYDRFPNLASTGTTSGDVSEVDENFMAGDEEAFPSGYLAHQGHMFNHGHNSHVGKYLSNVGSFDDEIFALRYNDHASNMPDSPEDYSGFDYPYHYGV